MSVATDILLAPDVRPFAVAAAIMVSLGGIELLTMIVGFSISELVGHDFGLDSDSHNGIGGLFLWINAGRLPLLILIILALGIFSIAGFLLQGIAHGAGAGLRHVGFLHLNEEELFEIPRGGDRETSTPDRDHGLIAA